MLVAVVVVKGCKGKVEFKFIGTPMSCDQIEFLLHKTQPNYIFVGRISTRRDDSHAPKIIVVRPVDPEILHLEP